MTTIDHLVYGTPHLEETVQRLAETLGVAPSPGGQHMGRGTRNYLLSLRGSYPHKVGHGAYLEIIGPDPDQPAPAGPRSFLLDDLHEPMLVGWAAGVTNIDDQTDRARTAGYDPGRVIPMSRTLPDGSTVSWRLTSRPQESIPVAIPFLIDWGNTPHPSTTSAQGAELLTFNIESPDAEDVRHKLSALGLTVEVTPGSRTLLRAHIRGPHGELTLR